MTKQALITGMKSFELHFLLWDLHNASMIRVYSTALPSQGVHGSTWACMSTISYYEGNENAGSTPAQEELMFVQQGNAEPPIEEIQCYNCQYMGHYARGCELPYVRRGCNNGVQLFQCDADDEEDDDDEG